MKLVPPSIRKTAFNCPHCSAYTTQTWSIVYTTPTATDNKLPLYPDEAERSTLRLLAHTDQRSAAQLRVVERMDLGRPFTVTQTSSPRVEDRLNNVWTSTCYNCGEVAIWVHDHTVYPPTRSGALPNADLPDDIRRDFEEARAIVDQSARGAAALLRLVIQKLCVHLGESARDLDAAIASLVRKGLSPMVQQALDVVRVIGNESVHPGTFDIRDDRDTANRLFDLINLVAEQMITHPKAVQALYDKLPEAKRKRIEQRDGGTV